MSAPSLLRPPANVCAVVLAAGEGRRLRPLTELRPKVLCPVNNVALLDLTLARLAEAGLVGPETVAVNACYQADRVVAHVGDRARLSVEPPPALGTAGGVANLRDWIAGRDVLVCNADSYLTGQVNPVQLLLDGWQRNRIRLLTVDDPDRGDFGPDRFAGISLMPWELVRQLLPVPSELHGLWRAADNRGELDLVQHPGMFFDCGTPDEYLDANLHASGGTNVIAPGVAVLGWVAESVLWPGTRVASHEHLRRVIRAARPDGTWLTVHAG